MVNRKRNIQMKFWVTEEEKRLIDEKMAQLPTKRYGAWAFPSPLAWRTTASICLRSARVSLRLAPAGFAGLAVFACNRSHLLFQFVLPHQGGVQVVGLVDPRLWADKFVFNEMSQEHLQGLPVLLVHPIPVKMLSDLRHCFTHTKATVLKVKPQASITPQPSRSMGKVIQRNRAQSPAASRDTGSALMASMLMVG